MRPTRQGTGETLGRSPKLIYEMKPNQISVIAATLGMEEGEVQENRHKPITLENPSVYAIDYDYFCVSPDKPIHKGFSWREWHDQYHAEQVSTKLWASPIYE